MFVRYIHCVYKMAEHKCIYCGNEALFQLKNGKWCCTPKPSSCPARRKANSEAAKNNWKKLKSLGIKKQQKGILKEASSFDFEQSQLQLQEHPETCFCAYCGAPAKFVLKCGKFCCSPFANQCPAIRKKNSEGLKLDYQQRVECGLPKAHYDYNSLPNETKERMKPIKKGDTLVTNPIIRKKRDTCKKLLESGEYVPWNRGVPHSDAEKDKIKQGVEKYLKLIGRTGGARFSIKACEFIDQLNNEHGWKLQHALNGGEIAIGKYYLDGYDVERNIAFEYDESSHYVDVINNILKPRDLERQRDIIEQTGCTFYRYNEELGLLYRV